MPFVVRGGILHLQTTFESKRYRFSTKLKDSAEHRKFVVENLHALIQAHNKMAACVDSISPFSVGGYLQRLIQQNAFSKKSTQATYKSRANVLRSLFACQKDVRSVCSDDIEKFYSNIIARNYSKNMAKSLINMLNSVFNMALCDGVIAKNPVFRKKMSILTSTKEAKPFNLDEIKTIIHNAGNVKQWFKYACAISFFTGLRSGELLALKWEHIDLQKRILSVECNMSRFGITSPKTLSSKREVEILEPLYTLLQEFKNLCKGKDGFLFVDANGKPFVSTSGEWTKLWIETLKQSHLPYRRFYNTRHSFASVMLSGGENIMWVSKILGHKNANITLNTYAKFIKQNVARATFLNGIDFN